MKFLLKWPYLASIRVKCSTKKVRLLLGVLRDLYAHCVATEQRGHFAVPYFPLILTKCLL